MLKILYNSPVEMGVHEHTDAIKNAIGEVGARRVAIDSLMDIEIATPDKVRYKDYVYSLVRDRTPAHSTASTAVACDKPVCRDARSGHGTG